MLQCSQCAAELFVVGWDKHYSWVPPAPTSSLVEGSHNGRERGEWHTQIEATNINGTVNEPIDGSLCVHEAADQLLLDRGVPQTDLAGEELPAAFGQ